MAGPGESRTLKKKAESAKFSAGVSELWVDPVSSCRAHFVLDCFNLILSVREAILDTTWHQKQSWDHIPYIESVWCVYMFVRVRHMLNNCLYTYACMGACVHWGTLFIYVYTSRGTCQTPLVSVIYCRMSIYPSVGANLVEVQRQWSEISQSNVCTTCYLWSSHIFLMFGNRCTTNLIPSLQLSVRQYPSLSPVLSPSSMLYRYSIVSSPYFF